MTSSSRVTLLAKLRTPAVVAPSRAAWPEGMASPYDALHGGSGKDRCLQGSGYGPKIACES